MPQPQVRVSLVLRFAKCLSQSKSGLKVCVGGIAKCHSHKPESVWA